MATKQPSANRSIRLAAVKSGVQSSFSQQFMIQTQEWVNKTLRGTDYGHITVFQTALIEQL